MCRIARQPGNCAQIRACTMQRGRVVVKLEAQADGCLFGMLYEVRSSEAGNILRLAPRQRSRGRCVNVSPDERLAACLLGKVFRLPAVDGRAAHIPL